MTPSISVTVFLTPVRCKVNLDPELESADSTVRAGVGYAETRAAGFNDGSWPPPAGYSRFDASFVTAGSLQVYRRNADEVYRKSTDRDLPLG